MLPEMTHFPFDPDRLAASQTAPVSRQPSGETFEKALLESWSNEKENGSAPDTCEKVEKGSASSKAEIRAVDSALDQSGTVTPEEQLDHSEDADQDWQSELIDTEVCNAPGVFAVQDTAPIPILRHGRDTSQDPSETDTFDLSPLRPTAEKDRSSKDGQAFTDKMTSTANDGAPVFAAQNPRSQAHSQHPDKPAGTKMTVSEGFEQLAFKTNADRQIRTAGAPAEQLYKSAEWQASGSGRRFERLDTTPQRGVPTVTAPTFENTPEQTREVLSDPIGIRSRALDPRSSLFLQTHREPSTAPLSGAKPEAAVVTTVDAPTMLDGKAQSPTPPVSLPEGESLAQDVAPNKNKGGIEPKHPEGNFRLQHAGYSNAPESTEMSRIQHSLRVWPDDFRNSSNQQFTAHRLAVPETSGQVKLDPVVASGVTSAERAGGIVTNPAQPALLSDAQIPDPRAHDVISDIAALTPSDSRLSPGVSQTVQQSNAQMYHGTAVVRQILDVVVQSRDRAIELRLNPEELGHVRMQISATDQGITLHISAERAETLQILRRNIDQLYSDLTSMGYDNPQFSFDQHSHRDEGAKNMAEPVSDDVANTAADLIPTSQAPSQGMDIRV